MPTRFAPPRRRLACAAILALAGCRAAVERVFQPPTAALRAVTVTGIGIEGPTLSITLALANPNPYPLSATSASYELLAGDSVAVGRGNVATPLRVGGRDSALVQLPLAVSWSGISRVGRTAIRGGAVEYRIRGEVLADTPLGARSVPIDARGRFAPPALGR